MTVTTIKVTKDTLTPALQRAAARAEDMTPLMQELSVILLDAIEQNFEDEGNPRWSPLSPVTKARGREGGKILQDTGKLAASFSADYDKDSAVAGTNDVKATTHNFGAKQGAFGKSSRGGPIPWGNIPAREFMNLGPQSLTEFENAFLDYFSPL